MPDKKLKLYGFNNLTKSLSFNIYDVCYAKSEREQRDYIAYIDEQYNSERLTNILSHVTDMIGAQVLSVSKQDYDPQGASVTFLIAEEHMIPTPSSDTLVAHLDKSHVTVHTFPEYHPDNAISTFRVDIDVSTCGTVSPLNALNYLIGSFDSDIITMDYRVRGFTRDIAAKSCLLPRHHLDPGLYRRQDLGKVRRERFKRLPVQFIPHQNAHEGSRPAELSVQHGCLRASAEDSAADYE
jgi:S-adenosylmethionine decarboxylase